MRISKSEALSGGVSDPRNATLLKMFSFIRFGERAGSGLNGIVYVWKKVYHTDPEIFVKEEYDRTFLKLPTLGKEPDVEAMAEFYPDEEDTSDKQAINIDTVDKTSDKQATNIDTIDKTSDKRAIILDYITKMHTASTTEIAKVLDISLPRTRFYLNHLVKDGLLIANGANKNRTYSLNIDIVDKCQGK